MLRNSFLENYEGNKKNISEFEKVALAHDENHILNLERPISINGIKKLPNDNLHKFIDDVMCNNKMNNLLYSSTAKNVLRFYLKQKKSLLKANNKIDDSNPFLFHKNKRPIESLFLKKQKSMMLEEIKSNLTEFKINQNKSMQLLTNKNNKFFKSQENSQKILKHLFYKPVNDIRLKDYRRAFKSCMNKSKEDMNFNLPDVSFKMNDVYSRLYYNAILSPDNIIPRCNSSMICERTKKNSFGGIKKTSFLDKNNCTAINNEKISTISNNNIKKRMSLNSTEKSIIFNKKKISTSISVNNNSDIKYRYIPKFHLKRVLKGYEGKEFSIKKNKKNYSICLRHNSCGPVIKKSPKKTNNEINNNSSINFNVYNDNCEKEDYDYDTEKNLIIDVNFFRDKENRTNLHIAVLKNSPKFVKYFLSKNYDPNAKNKFGNTPLHLAMSKKNKTIIKLLLDSGADTSIKNNNGVTPYDLASKDIQDEFKLETPLL